MRGEAGVLERGGQGLPPAWVPLTPPYPWCVASLKVRGRKEAGRLCPSFLHRWLTDPGWWWRSGLGTEHQQGWATVMGQCPSILFPEPDCHSSACSCIHLFIQQTQSKHRLCARRCVGLGEKRLPRRQGRTKNCLLSAQGHVS